MRQMHIRRERGTGWEEGNSATSEHANPVLQGKKASQLQSRYGYKQVKHSAASQGRREGKQTALCYLVSTLKSQDLPLTGLLWTKLWRQENSGLSWNLISVSCVGVAAGVAWMKRLYLSRDTWPLARKFCWDLLCLPGSYISATAWRVSRQKWFCRDQITDRWHSKTPTEARGYNFQEDNRGYNTLDMRHNIVNIAALFLFLTPCCSASGVGGKLDISGVAGTIKTFCLEMRTRPLSTPTF